MRRFMENPPPVAADCVYIATSVHQAHRRQDRRRHSNFMDTINGGENTNDPFLKFAEVGGDCARRIGMLAGVCAIKAACRPGSAVARPAAVSEEVRDGREGPE